MWQGSLHRVDHVSSAEPLGIRLAASADAAVWSEVLVHQYQSFPGGVEVLHRLAQRANWLPCSGRAGVALLHKTRLKFPALKPKLHLILRIELA